MGNYTEIGRIMMTREALLSNGRNLVLCWLPNASKRRVLTRRKSYIGRRDSRTIKRVPEYPSWITVSMIGGRLRIISHLCEKWRMITFTCLR
jgi:hypothetical protein